METLQKMTYNERVDKMARSLNAAGTCYAPYREVHGELYIISAAKEAVAKQAQAIREFYMSLGTMLGTLPYWDEKFLLEYGYIESEKTV